MSQTQETPSFQEMKALALYAFIFKAIIMLDRRQPVGKCKLSWTINTDLSFHEQGVRQI